MTTPEASGKNAGEGMKLWIVHREEYSGYDCNGHMQTYVVVAENAVQATELVADTYHVDVSEVAEAVPLELPNLNRLKKPRVIA